MRDIFNFTSTKGGYLLASYSFLRAIGSLIILPICLKCFKIKEWILCLVIIPIQCGFYLFNAFAQNYYHLFFGFYTCYLILNSFIFFNVSRCLSTCFYVRYF